ncbi:hypothetical protein NQ315_003910 [Exocentrus adspersus]|uniref:Uncharacterized protein n=1 Tax=Exocentrus adspersus TaxID=1586481 RepID=A0AAV8VZK1_9CUCU|nr:hypothetical protein NQ315_003910 [Exocentrus adspersus]
MRVKMKHKTFIFTFLLATVAAAGPKDKKTTLEDIERDYTSSEMKTKLTPPPPPPSATKISVPTQSPTHYGFVPRKTIANYVQQSPRPVYVQPDYAQQYTQQYIQQSPENDYSQYATAQQYTTSIPQKYNSGSQQYFAPQYSTAQQKYTPQVPSQQSFNYVMQLPNQLQSYENVQYITDNSIAAPATQQYYTPAPQYVYLQQYTAPSTAIQTVVEPKGALQYIMYVPSLASPATAEQTQSYDNVVYEGEDTQDVTSYQAPQPLQTVQYTTQQAPKEQAPVQYTQPKDLYTRPEYIIKREPKSLLDSYIPSIVQLRYRNRILQQNSVQEPIKISQSVSGKPYIKNVYRTEEPSDAGSSVRYRYQPSSYSS